MGFWVVLGGGETFIFLDRRQSGIAFDAALLYTATGEPVETDLLAVTVQCKII
jgi:hypothetical protein